MAIARRGVCSMSYQDQPWGTGKKMGNASVEGYRDLRSGSVQQTA